MGDEAARRPWTMDWGDDTVNAKPGLLAAWNDTMDFFRGCQIGQTDYYGIGYLRICCQAKSHDNTSSEIDHCSNAKRHSSKVSPCCDEYAPNGDKPGYKGTAAESSCPTRIFATFAFQQWR